MAMNIGANDVANNVACGWLKSLNVIWCFSDCSYFEAAGALIAGGEVVGTIRNGIINPNLITDSQTFVWIMMAGFISSSIMVKCGNRYWCTCLHHPFYCWCNYCSGIAASGMDIVNWGKMTEIAASWVISPVLGGLVAAAMLYFVKEQLFIKAIWWVLRVKLCLWLIAFMGWTFGTYLYSKALNRIWKVSFLDASLIGGVSRYYFIYTVETKSI